MAPRARVLLMALAVDVVCGEPPACLHPVVAMGRGLDWLEQHAPVARSSRLVYGVGVAIVYPLAWAMVTELLFGRAPWPLQAVVLKSTLAGRALLEAGARVEAALASGDATAGRQHLRALVSRSTEELEGGHLASAAVESLAENLVDSWLAPLLAFATVGLGGATAYRVMNTADAMWGYHTARYEALGKAVARLDDALNWLPARVGAALLVLASGGSRAALDVWRRDGGGTASPNAGQVMASAAGALGVQLEKVGHYRLNAPAPLPEPGTIGASRRLVGRAMVLSAVLALAGCWLRPRG
ncbi:MAG: cobalamin biosynthesis protein CobD [Chloroflexi bacterium]|nr:cobalamin biosynthesis protein CobD [Chloroflexota bacterium]